MPFLLDGDPTQSEISDAVNYLLSNFSAGITSDPNTGQITAPTAGVIGYLYQYLAVKYADSFDGSVNFSNSPTGRAYYGLRNSNYAAESTNPVDYIWTKVTGGFGSTKFLWYQTTGGRAIQLAVATTAPDAGWLQDTGASIDLDVITSATVPVIAETFFAYFTPSTLQVPRTGSTLTPVFTNVNAVMFATDKGTVVPFVDAQTDSNVAFVNNTWRIGNSSTTGFGDISYTNITVGNPTDAGDYALWPIPTAMSGNPAYITVPVRFKNSLGVVTQAAVAKVQYVFADPGATGPVGSSIDISGYTSFVQNSGGAYTPTNATLSALLSNVTSPTYSWTISGATPTTASTASVVVTPTSSSTGVDVTLTVNGSNLLSPISKSIKMPVVYDGAAGTAGANGVMSAFPTIYIWTGSSTPPTRPSTTSTYTWSSGTFTAPSGWATEPPTNTVAGNYLWSITIPLTVSATTTTSTLDWTNTSYPIRAIAYNGANGANGANGVNGAATFVITRSANDGSEPTPAEVYAVLGRYAVSGDICTVSYNSANNAVVYRYITSWSLFVTYITGSLIVSNTITGDKVAANTITGTNIAASTITASNIASGTITATQIATNTITTNEINNVATGQIIAGSFNFVPFTSSGTFTVPAYVYKLKATVVGGGGGGGGSAYTNSGGAGGGGGGGCAIKILSVSPGDTFTVTIGPGGTAGSSSNGTGGTGGNSSFVGGSYNIVGNGGNGGTGGNNLPALGGIGGSASGGDLNLTGGGGGSGFNDSNSGRNTPGNGGGAAFIGAGARGNTAASANSGGGGGGGSSNTSAIAGQAGGSGVIFIEY
jgi:hypothetical protein